MQIERAGWRLMVTLLVLASQGCRGRTESDASAASSEAARREGWAADAEAPVVEVTVEDFAFVAPPQVRSGWNTFRLANTGEQPHFLLLWRLPEGVTFGEYAETVAQPFQKAYDRYHRREVSREAMLEAVGAALPPWFGQLEGRGGVGITSAGRTAQATTWLEPGDYVMECYVLSPEGQFHGTLGMLRPLVVTSEDTRRRAPDADLRITLSNYEMTVDGEPRVGPQTIAVHATQNPEGLEGHDVHLARLSADTSIEDVVAWMGWVDALRPPAPAEFLGGAEHVAAGRTGYFTVTLEPGRYAWISEGYADRGMVREFGVGADP